MCVCAPAQPPVCALNPLPCTPCHAAQIGAQSAGVGRALRATMSAAADLACYEYKVVQGKDKSAASQRECW